MAKKNVGKAAKRAAKKHAKEVKRRREVASRGRAAPAQRLPYDDWRPAHEGLEGLAKRMGISVHSAGGLAEHLLGHHGRKDAAGLWLPSKLHAMDVPAIVMALAQRGVVTNESNFRDLAVGYVSAHRFAETEWFPRLSEGHGVHDRDFCGAAAERLWGEWAVEIFSDEQIEATLDGVEVAVAEGDPESAAQRLLRAWEGLEPGEAPERLQRAGLLPPFVALAEDVVREATFDEDMELETRAALADALRHIRAEPTLDHELGFRLDDLLNDLDWSVGRSDEVISRLLEAASSGEPIPALDAAVLVLSKHDASPVQLQRVRAALAALLPTVSEDFVEDIEAFLSELDDAQVVEPTT